MCFTRGTFLIIYSPRPKNAVPTQEEVNTPVAKMKSIAVMKPNPKTWKPNRYSYSGLKKLSKNSRNHHVTYTVTTTGKSIALQRTRRDANAIELAVRKLKK